MSLRFFDTSNDLYRYMLDVSLRESPLLRDLRAETEDMDGAIMQTAPEAGQFLALLARMLKARTILEIGVYTGYSSLCLAQTLPADGRLVACDLSKTWTRTAERYWERAGVRDRVDLRLGPALDTMDALLAEDDPTAFDLVFLDADKENYTDYYDRAYELTRPGGLIVVDNVLWAGRVADSSETDSETVGIRKLNDRIRRDDRVVHSLVPIADGYSLVWKPNSIDTAAPSASSRTSRTSAPDASEPAA